MSKLFRVMAVSALGGATVLAAQHATASGLALQEQNTSGLGNSYAGSAAVAEDASTLFFNSAGLTQLTKPSLVMSVSVIDFTSRFKDEGSVRALGQPLGTNGGNAGSTPWVPAVYVSVPLTETISGGIGFNSPFGLKTHYGNGWLGRFQAVKSDVKTMNLNAALAFKLSPMVSLGVGIDHQTIDAELSSAVNYSGVIAGVNSALLGVPANLGLEGSSLIKGNDSAWGYDLGLLLTPSEHTRIGLSWRSAMKYTVEGTATFAAPSTSDATGQAIINGASNPLNPNPAAPFKGNVTLKVKLPASARLAIAHDLSSKVQLLGEVSWTQWSSIPELRIVRSSGASGTLKNTPENWGNSWRYAVGANFQVLPLVKLRVGAAVDKTPVPDADRTPRLPDGNRTWLSTGMKLQLFKRSSVDLGYARIMLKDAKLNQADGYSALQGYPNGVIRGHQEATINVFGAQATVTF